MRLKNIKWNLGIFQIHFFQNVCLMSVGFLFVVIMFWFCFFLLGFCFENVQFIFETNCKLNSLLVKTIFLLILFFMIFESAWTWCKCSCQKGSTNIGTRRLSRVSFQYRDWFFGWDRSQQASILISQVSGARRSVLFNFSFSVFTFPVFSISCRSIVWFRPDPDFFNYF